MLIESTSKYLLKKTRAKAKMYEYRIDEELHVEVEENVPDLLLIAIGAIGNISSSIIRTGNTKMIEMDDVQSDLEFSSKFFDAYLSSKFDEESNYYYYLLGSIAYFFANRIGSAHVLIRKINLELLNLECNGIEKLLVHIIKDDLNYFYDRKCSNPYKELLSNIDEQFMKYSNYNQDIDMSWFSEMRNKIYEAGTSLELLLFDSLYSIFLIKLENSALNTLPLYSDVERELWEKAIIDGKLINELWPSQRKLGESGVYKGKSAVIQMPTGTGKTKSISLMIYSAFISGRANLAVVVAPFRALCSEIRYDLEKDFKFDDSIIIDQMSDVLQLEDMIIGEIDLSKKTIVVLTPEKLLYIIRQQPEFVENIDIAIFDEAHLFDDGHRGTTYELLISVLKKSLGEKVQKVLISAVMSNAYQLNDWINEKDSGVVISDNAIKSTEKQVAITDLRKSGGEDYGYLFFVNPKNPEEEEFYVPRLIRFHNLGHMVGERKDRFFPERDKENRILNNDAAIYYGLHLCSNGQVALFCGKKLTGNNILKRILDIEKRGYDISTLRDNSNEVEINRICNLIKDNYGEDNVYFEAANRAAFVHHAGISNGIRNSIEYAMRKNLLSFLVCTSTLAQGVNLPIKYLVVSTLYQGREHISVRDFHNLIGRAGRSGVHTEGSILLTETGIYNTRKNYNNWKWKDYKNILNEQNSEPCLSTLLNLVRPVNLNYEFNVNFYDIIVHYYTDDEKFNKWMDFVTKSKESFSDGLRYHHSSIMITLDAIESFIMSYLHNVSKDEEYEELVITLLEGTYGYFLCGEEEKLKLIDLFKLIGNYVIENTENDAKRLLYSKSLMGVNKNREIEKWIDSNREDVELCSNTIELFKVIAPFLYEHSESSVLSSLDILEGVIQIGELWINGESYNNILNECIKSKIRIVSRKKIKFIDLFDVIEICDKGFGYSTILLVSALNGMYSSNNDNEKITNLFTLLETELRYGLPNKKSILIYEMGFSDRVVAQKISENIEIPMLFQNKDLIREYLSKKKSDINDLLQGYPQVYLDRVKYL